MLGISTSAFQCIIITHKLSNGLLVVVLLSAYFVDRAWDAFWAKIIIQNDLWAIVNANSYKNLTPKVVYINIDYAYIRKNDWNDM